MRRFDSATDRITLFHVPEEDLRLVEYIATQLDSRTAANELQRIVREARQRPDREVVDIDKGDT